jgi:hypothetical protein
MRNVPPGRSEPDRVRDAFGEAHYEHLVALKDIHDPHNLFHHNQNVRPSKPVGERSLA